MTATVFMEVRTGTGEQVYVEDADGKQTKLPNRERATLYLKPGEKITLEIPAEDTKTQEPAKTKSGLAGSLGK